MYIEVYKNRKKAFLWLYHSIYTSLNFTFVSQPGSSQQNIGKNYSGLINAFYPLI